MKKAFSLIELIFTIVIIGVAFLSVPTIIFSSSRSLEHFMESRGYNHAISKINIIKNFAWDEANANDLVNLGFYSVLHTQQDDAGTELMCPRAGHYAVDYHRVCSANVATAIGNDGEADGSFNDIDDFDGSTDALSDGFTTTVTVEYAPYQNATVAMTYQSANIAAQTTGIKRIRIAVTDSANGNAITNYYYYSANIGKEAPLVKPN